MKKLTKAGCYGRLVLPGVEKNVIDDPSQIVYIKGDDHYIHIYLADGSRRMLTVCLKYVLQRLDPYKFFRSHRSYIINMDQVRTYRRCDRKLIVKMRDGNEIPVVRRSVGSFFNLLYANHLYD